jgi:Ca2+-binding EF-hand superfamily protein
MDEDEQVELSLVFNNRLCEQSSSRSWYKLFRKLDKGGLGIPYRAFELLVRHRLELSSHVLPDEHLQSLWVALDSERSGSLSWQSFNRFTRRGERKLGELHRSSLRHQKEVRAKENAAAVRAMKAARTHRHIKQELIGVPRADAGMVKSLSERCNQQLRDLYQDEHQSWFKLFKHMDKDSSGLISFAEFSSMVREELLVPAHALDEQSLKMVWLALDTDDSGHISAREFRSFMRLGEPAGADIMRISEQRRQVAHSERARIEEAKLTRVKQDAIETAVRAKQMQEEAKLVEAELARLKQEAAAVRLREEITTKVALGHILTDDELTQLKSATDGQMQVSALYAGEVSSTATGVHTRIGSKPPAYGSPRRKPQRTPRGSGGASQSNPSMARRTRTVLVPS